jgi:hypothetical protein
VLVGHPDPDRSSMLSLLKDSSRFGFPGFASPVATAPCSSAILIPNRSSLLSLLKGSSRFGFPGFASQDKQKRFDRFLPCFIG